MASALSYLTNKTVIPAEARSAQWAAVPVWDRELAMWISSCTRADIIEESQHKIAGILAGAKSEETAITEIHDYLKATGYMPEPGLEGTIKDLRTDQRLKVMVRTNVAMARGWAQRQQFAGDIANPGLKLKRMRQSRVPRNWIDRCAQFSGRDDVVLTGKKDEPMIALSTSPVWAMLSAFGTPHPPFDYNSNMGVVPVSYDECVTAGLITPENEDEMLDRVEAECPRSLNDGLEMQRNYSVRGLRESIAQSMGGLVRWEGNTLKFTDPNGSKQYGWNEVGEVINAKLPGDLPNLQARALRDWVNDHTAFEGDASISGKAGWDEREDLARLVNRINPVNSQDAGNAALYRGMTVENHVLDGWLQSGKYTIKPGKMFDSWSVSESGMQKYLKGEIDSAARKNVVLVMDDYRDVRPIHAAVRSVSGIQSPNPAQILQTDGEVIATARSGYQIVKSSTDPKTGVVTLTIRQISK